MKINFRNLDKIAAALREAHPQASAHIFHARQLELLIPRIHAHLQRRGFRKADMRGIKGAARSGAALANAYKYSRQVSRIEFELGANGEVFLTAIAQVTAGREAGWLEFRFSEAEKAAIAAHAISEARTISI